MPGAGACRRVVKEDDVLSQHAETVDMTAARHAGAESAADNATSKQLLDEILDSLASDKAEDVVTIDLRGRTELADHMVIASGRSTRQVAAISEKLVDRLKQEFGRLSKVEGKDAGDWVLIDTGDVIVHVFRPEVREFYALEKMWLPTEPR
ncbi:ribosome silencing factor [Brevirhabdus pacifica]|uniref:Ribosomal silencing factor RsfS n=2 Tax=Brevirhabdus pacifica TaxID=1267768 RepID=A0A1U7DJE9_9RHOB|nr:ribosome silencing factor [Brevirhabdus pacifica]